MSPSCSFPWPASPIRRRLPCWPGLLGSRYVIGVLASAISHALFPDAPGPAKVAAAPAGASPEAAGWTALQATLVVMPVFVMALTNPAMYLQCVMKTVGLGQQAGATNARTAGRELVGSTLVGGIAGDVGLGRPYAPAEPVDVRSMDGGRIALDWRQALPESRRTSFPPSYWLNALMTMFFVLGPAIADSANGADVYRNAAMRLTLFVGVALYASATVWVLERWRASRSRSLLPERG